MNYEVEDRVVILPNPGETYTVTEVGPRSAYRLRDDNGRLVWAHESAIEKAPETIKSFLESTEDVPFAYGVWYTLKTDPNEVLNFKAVSNYSLLVYKAKYANEFSLHHGQIRTFHTHIDINRPLTDIVEIKEKDLTEMLEKINRGL